MDQITIVHYIRQHLFDSIRVENIAKELYISPPVPFCKIQRRSGRNADGFHLERKNGGSKTPPPLLRQIIQFYRS